MAAHALAARTSEGSLRKRTWCVFSGERGLLGFHFGCDGADHVAVLDQGFVEPLLRDSHWRERRVPKVENALRQLTFDTFADEMQRFVDVVFRGLQIERDRIWPRIGLRCDHVPE